VCGLVSIDLPSIEDLGEAFPKENADADFRLSLTVNFCISVAIVETEDTDDASSSSFPVIPLIIFDAVEFCLFFLGIVGNTFPGSSVRILLCSLAKSP